MPEEPSSDAPETPPSGSTGPRSPRLKGLTPELRRFLGAPRTRADKPPPAPVEESLEVEPEHSAPTTEVPRMERRPAHISGPRATVSASSRREDAPPEDERRVGAGLLRPDQKASRIPELQRAIVILGALLLLGLVFYVGMKFPFWRYQYLTSRHAAKLEGTVAAKFPGVSSEDLIKQGLEAERAGKPDEAAQRFIAAKYKNPGQRGILARVGRIAFKAKDFAAADKFFEQAIAFGENVDLANYFRGLIALQKKDYPAALRSFAAAAAAEPFVGDYQYQMGETLRLDHRPREAIAHYEQAARLVGNRGEEVVCRIKIRLARLEAGEMSNVREEIEAQKKKDEKLPVEWSMTAAALHIREGEIDEAIPFILLARDGTEPGVFGSCVVDPFFVDAAQKQTRVKEAMRTAN